MRASIGSSNVSEGAPASRLGADYLHEPYHVVQFYDSDSFLVETVRDFIADGLRKGEDAVVVATRQHREAIELALSRSGINLEEARAEGRYRSLDAASTLAGLVVGGAVDEGLFEKGMGELIAASAGEARPVRLFGEMVTLLWNAGNVAGAIHLEDLWCSLLEAHPIALMCAYPMHAFSREGDGERFNEICARHSRVLPTESYGQHDRQSEQLLAVARMQQRIAQDETERTGMALERMQLEEAIKRLKELDTLRNDFVSMVVHDIRTPNAVVGAFLEILRKDWGTLDDERIDDLLARALANTEHVSRLVDDIMTASRIESGDFNYDLKPLDVTEIVYRAVGAARAANEAMRFEVSLPDGLPPALGDEARQLQILHNLLSNAAKFSASTSCVNIAVRREGYHLRIDVQDEGLGISAADQCKLFTRFSRIESRVHPKTKGTGLGLYITKALVEGQGGTVSVTSEPGVGSTFSYTVPAVRRRYVKRRN